MAKTRTHKQLVGKMLNNLAVKTEVKYLNQGGFAIFDEILSARKAVGLTRRKLLNAWVCKLLVSQN